MVGGSSLKPERNAVDDGSGRLSADWRTGMFYTTARVAGRCIIIREVEGMSAEKSMSPLGQE